MLHLITTAGAAFLTWWGRELRACVPDRLRDLMVGRPRTLEVLVSVDALVFSLATKAGREDLGRVGTGRAQADVVADARALLAGHGLPTEAVVRLPPEAALRTSVDLPTAAAGNLREVLAFQMDSLTPFVAGDVVFDFAVTGTDDGMERLMVDLLVARASDADRALGWVQAIGLEPLRLTDTEADGPFDLVPPERRHRRRSLSLRLAAALTGLAVGLGLVTLGLWFESKQDELALLEQRASTLRAELLARTDQADRVRHLIEVSERLDRRKVREPLVIDLVAEVSRILPDGHWLTTWTLAGETLGMSGYTADPEGMLRLLEASERLAGAHFTTSLSRDPQIGLERFAVEVSVAGREERP